MANYENKEQQQEINQFSSPLHSDGYSDSEFLEFGSSSSPTTELKISTPRIVRNKNFHLEYSKMIWCVEYSEDIYYSLREIEKNRIRINRNSPQLILRTDLIKFIKYAGVNLELAKLTVHLAVYLLDVFMDSWRISGNKIKAVALSCILLASKIEEKDSNVPTLDKLKNLVPDTYSHAELKNIEIRILNCCKWYLLYPTAATFVENFISKTITMEEFNEYLNVKPLLIDRGLDLTCLSEMFATVYTLTFEFLDLILEDIDLVRIAPSLMAAACVGATRKILKIQPIWNDRLVMQTGYSYYEIESKVVILFERKMTLEKIDKLKNTPDSGIMSDLEISSDDDSQIEDKKQVGYHAPSSKKIRLY